MCIPQYFHIYTIYRMSTVILCKYICHSPGSGTKYFFITLCSPHCHFVPTYKHITKESKLFTLFDITFNMLHGVLLIMYTDSEHSHIKVFQGYSWRICSMFYIPVLPWSGHRLVVTHNQQSGGFPWWLESAWEGCLATIVSWQVLDAPAYGLYVLWLKMNSQ